MHCLVRQHTFSAQAEDDEQDDATDDADVSDVGDGPVEADFWNFQVQEIGDIALAQAIDDIAECAAELQAERNA